MRNLQTVKQFSAEHPAWSPAALRNLIFNAKPRQSSRGEIPGNGLSPAIVRVGGKVLIDADRFFDWVEAQQEEDVA